MAETPSSFILPLGAPLPTFSLPDPSGTLFSSPTLPGANGLLVIFACNHCPYVIHLADAIATTAQTLLQHGIHTIAINSNDTSAYPLDHPERMPAFADAHSWKFPYLIDSSQSVANAFFATCTPDFFLFDSHHRLYYTGQFDSSRPKSKLPPTGDDLLTAAQRMLRHESPPSNPIPSTGCNIKWLPNQAPSWLNTPQ